MRESILKILKDRQLDLPSTANLHQTAGKMELYIKEMVRWNTKINLTSQKDEVSILNKHVFNSLQFARSINPSSRVMDIGSGAGFPGIPLKIILPGIHLVLVESRRKRANFLGNVMRILELRDVKILNNRAEDLGSKYENEFDSVLFRSVTGIKNCLKLGARFLCPTGSIILMKEPGANLDSAFTEEHFSLRLKKDIPVVDRYGKESKLMIFENCST